MVDAGSISIKLGLDSTGLKTGLADAKQGLTSWRDETNKSSAEMLKWGAAVGATIAPITAAGAAAYDAVQKFGTMAQQLRDLSYTTGLTTKRLQELQYAATLSGTSFSTVTTGLNQFTLTVAEAGKAGSEAQKSFEAIGVTTSGRTVDQLFDDTAKALVDMEDETTRNQIAMNLYGKSWKELLPYLDTYIAKAKEIKANPYLTDEDLDNFEEAKVAIDALSSKLTTLEGQVIGTYLKVEGMRSDFVGGILGAIFGTKKTDESLTTTAEAQVQSVEKATIALEAFTDKYEGLTDSELERLQITEDLAQAEKDRAAATNQIDYDALSIKIQSYKNQLEGLNAVNKSVAASTGAAAWVATSVVGSAGSEMQLFLQREMELGTSYQDALNNWVAGSPTNATPASNTLEAVSGNLSSKNLSPGSSAQTKAVETEYAAQTTALESLTDSTIEGFQKQSDAFKQYMVDLATFRTEQYPVLEKLDLVHWATNEEIARVATQKELDFMAACVNFGGKNPIIQNYIVMGKHGADWTPPPFQAVTAPTLGSADFTQVGAAVQSIVNKGLGEGTSATTNVKVSLVVEDKTTNGIKATNAKTKAESQALASVTGIGGIN